MNSAVPLLPPPAPPEQVSMCCSIFPPLRTTSLEQQSVSDILDRLQTLARVQNARQLALHNHEQEELRDAVLCAERGDREGGKSHVRVAQRLRKERALLLQKRENIMALASQLKNAHDNAVMARLIGDSNVTLETLLGAMGDSLDSVLDNLRQHLERVDEDSRTLAEPLRMQEDEEEEEELLFVPKNLQVPETKSSKNVQVVENLKSSREQKVPIPL